SVCQSLFAMSGSIGKGLEQELKCPLCRAWFVRPLLLPCGHSLCRDCWAGIQQAPADDQMSVLSETDSGVSLPASRPDSLVTAVPGAAGTIGGFLCPACRKPVAPPHSQQLPANRALERLVSAAAAASSANKDHGSQDCGNDEDVVELNDCRRHPGEPGAFCLSCRGSFACGLCAGEEPCAAEARRSRRRRRAAPACTAAGRLQSSEGFVEPQSAYSSLKMQGFVEPQSAYSSLKMQGFVEPQSAYSSLKMQGFVEPQSAYISLKMQGFVEPQSAYSSLKMQGFVEPQSAYSCLKMWSSTELSQALQSLSEQAKSGSEFLQRLKSSSERIKSNREVMAAAVTEQFDSLVSALQSKKQ
uniref:RING-type domain-containing protein n=1 Tax=Macrostomum lignano TaxID=282301 RepID=A0A1I8JMV8_9PLAT